MHCTLITTRIRAFQVDPDVDVPTVGEIVFTVFDWMTTNKETIKSTKEVWEYTRRSLKPI